MSRNPSVSSTLPKRAQGVIEGYSSWEQLSDKASQVTTCFATTPGVKPTCCHIHQGLHSMLQRLHEQAALLEDLLIENQQIERRPHLCGHDFVNASTLIIIQRKDTGYSFARFSAGWLEMLQDFFHPQ